MDSRMDGWMANRLTKRERERQRDRDSEAERQTARHTNMVRHWTHF